MVKNIYEINKIFKMQSERHEENKTTRQYYFSQQL